MFLNEVSALMLETQGLSPTAAKLFKELQKVGKKAKIPLTLGRAAQLVHEHLHGRLKHNQPQDWVAALRAVPVPLARRWWHHLDHGGQLKQRPKRVSFYRAKKETDALQECTTPPLSWIESLVLQHNWTLALDYLAEQVCIDEADMARILDIIPQRVVSTQTMFELRSLLNEMHEDFLRLSESKEVPRERLVRWLIDDIFNDSWDDAHQLLRHIAFLTAEETDVLEKMLAPQANDIVADSGPKDALLQRLRLKTAVNAEQMLTVTESIEPAQQIAIKVISLDLQESLRCLEARDAARLWQVLTRATDMSTEHWQQLQERLQTVRWSGASWTRVRNKVKAQLPTVVVETADGPLLTIAPFEKMRRCLQEAHCAVVREAATKAWLAPQGWAVYGENEHSFEQLALPICGLTESKYATAAVAHLKQVGFTAVNFNAESRTLISDSPTSVLQLKWLYEKAFEHRWQLLIRGLDQQLALYEAIDAPSADAKLLREYERIDSQELEQRGDKQAKLVLKLRAQALRLQPDQKVFLRGGAGKARPAQITKIEPSGLICITTDVSHAAQPNIQLLKPLRVAATELIKSATLAKKIARSR